MISTKVYLTYKYSEKSTIQVMGRNLHSDDITVEFDVEILNSFTHKSEPVHILYSYTQDKVFEYNKEFNEDDPTSVQYIPFRYKVTEIKIKKIISL